MTDKIISQTVFKDGVKVLLTTSESRPPSGRYAVGTIIPQGKGIISLDRVKTFDTVESAVNNYLDETNRPGEKVSDYCVFDAVANSKIIAARKNRESIKRIEL